MSSLYQDSRSENRRIRCVIHHLDAGLDLNFAAFFSVPSNFDDLAFGRIIAALVHSGAHNIQITTDLLDSNIPTFSGELSQTRMIWVCVGPPSLKLIRRFSKGHNNLRLLVYLDESLASSGYQKTLHKVLQQDLSDLEHYTFSQNSEAALSELLAYAKHIECTVSDDTIYGEADGNYFSVEIERIKLTQVLLNDKR